MLCSWVGSLVGDDVYWDQGGYLYNKFPTRLMDAEHTCLYFVKDSVIMNGNTAFIYITLM